MIDHVVRSSGFGILINTVDCYSEIVYHFYVFNSTNKYGNPASDMWKHRNRDCHCCENGNNISLQTKIDQTIKNIYRKKELVINDDVDTYFDVDIDSRLTNSLQSKKN